MFPVIPSLITARGTPIPSLPVEIDHYTDTANDQVSLSNTRAAVVIGQSFTGKDFQIGTSYFSAFIGGAPTGSVYSRLYAAGGTFGVNNTPTGPAITGALATSDPLDITALPAGYKIFTFSGVNQYLLVDGTKYIITIEYYGGDNSNYLTVQYVSGIGTHAGNVSTASSADLTSWNVESWDLIFQLWSN